VSHPVSPEWCAVEENGKYKNIISGERTLGKLFIRIYSEISIHRFRQGSEKETIDPGKQ
jgi:hypothetical protein